MDNKKKQIKTNVILKFPKKIIQYDQITSAGNCLKLLDNQMAMIITALITAAGGNHEYFDIIQAALRW